MRTIAITLSVTLALAVATTALAAPRERPRAKVIPNPAAFEIRRGVNLSHWLSQCFGWSPRATFITEDDIRFIASLGYDHVRIPIDEKELWGEDNRPNEEAFGYLIAALDWCQRAKLRAIVDLHIVRAHYFNAGFDGSTNTLFTDPKAQENFLRLWREIGARIGKYPVDAVAYEIMNEPVAKDPADWNRLVARTVADIRTREPKRVLVIGSNIWQTAGTFPVLEVPKGDPNIILSVHTYAPLAFTHYKAYWTELKGYKGQVHYPGKAIDDADWEAYEDRKIPAVMARLDDARIPFGPEALRNVLLPAIEKARALGLQLYCGEFGCLPTVERQDRLAYYNDIVDVFQQNDLAWANWDYKGDFGIVGYDRERHVNLDRDAGLIEALLGATGRPVPAFPKKP